jgi:hypothetical protein
VNRGKGGDGARRRPARPAAWRTGLCGGLLAAWLVAPAGAWESPRAYLDAMDLDGDGRISLSEFQAYMIRGFDRLDVNRNGILDLDEQPPGPRRRPISRDEQLRLFAEAFHRQDVNADGYLDVNELSAPPR